MSNSKKNGIGGILDGILVSSPKMVLHREKPQETTTTNPQPQFSNETSKKSARRGRPLGKVRKPTTPKEKVTVWIDAALIARYRDWSWEARCQLSSLIEEALTAYEKRRKDC